MLEINKIHTGNCLDLMPLIPDESIDMVLCDLPYGTTACQWDTVIDLDMLWTEYARICKERAAIVMTASQPFTSRLVVSRVSWFRHEWIWEKTIAANFMGRQYAPAKYHENILVFGKKAPNYYPEMVLGEMHGNGWGQPEIYGNLKDGTNRKDSAQTYPSTIIRVPNPNKDNIHPTQKPVNLFRYLVRTYNRPGEIVLDNCVGSGTTAVACEMEGRRWIGIEMNDEYVKAANARLGKIQQGFDFI